ncbi:MAG: hypothetical protein WCO09_02800, partial [bacterium]
GFPLWNANITDNNSGNTYLSINKYESLSGSSYFPQSTYTFGDNNYSNSTGLSLVIKDTKDFERYAALGDNALNLNGTRLIVDDFSQNVRLEAGTSTISSPFMISGTTNINQGYLNVGDGGFSGALNSFNGSAAGTILALNATSTFTGDLLNLEVASSSKMKLDYLGNLTIAGNLTASSVTLSSLSNGSILFATSSGVISQNNSNFFWDNVNNRFGLGTNTPVSLFNAVGTPDATTTYGLISIGNGGFAGGPPVGTNHNFLGNMQGTILAVNATSTFVGDLIRLEVGGGDPAFKVDATGNILNRGGINSGAGQFSYIPGISASLTAKVNTFDIRDQVNNSFLSVDSSSGGVIGLGDLSHIYNNGWLTITGSSSSDGWNLSVGDNANSYFNIQPNTGTYYLGARSSGNHTVMGVNDSVVSSYPVGPQQFYAFSKSTGFFDSDSGTQYLGSNYALSPNYGTLSVGTGGFFGGLPNFIGSASGTQIAVNAPTSYSGDLVNMEVSGISKFKVDATGNLSDGNGTSNFLSVNSTNGQYSMGDMNGSRNLNYINIDDVNRVTSFFGNSTSTVFSGVSYTPAGTFIVNNINTLGSFIGSSTVTYTINIDNSYLVVRTISPLVASPGETFVVTSGAASGTTGVIASTTIAPPGFTANHVVHNGVVVYPGSGSGILITSGAHLGNTGTVSLSGSFAGTDNHFTWTDGTNSGSGYLPISPFALSHGISVDWGTTYDHSYGDTWTFTYSNSGRSFVLNNSTQQYSLGDVDNVNGNSVFTVGATSSSISRVSMFNISGTPSDASTGLLSLGDGGFTGLGNSFNGSASGTMFALNATSTFTGDLLNLEVASSSKMKLDASGNLTLAGTLIDSSLSINGGVVFATSSGLLSQNQNFFWDNVNSRLGLGTKTPISTLEVDGQIVSKGTTWLPVTNPLLTLNGVTYGNGMFVAVSNTGANVGMSQDGINWTSESIPSTVLQWKSVTYGNGLFVAVSNTASSTASTIISSDGINWRTVTTPIAVNWQSVTYGNGMFVGVGSSGAILTSPDGINWTVRTSPSPRTWKSVTYGNGIFVAVAQDGITSQQVMTSSDGITWTSSSPIPSTNTWTSVTYGNGMFVAVGNGGSVSNQVMTSTNGSVWIDRTIPILNTWTGVTYGNGIFVAVSSLGAPENKILISTDGINWTKKMAAGAPAFSGVAYGNGMFVAVVSSGVNPIMVSGSQEYSSVPNNNIYQGGITVNGSDNFWGAAPATTTSGLISVGDGGFAGLLNNFVGSASGTILALNATSTFGGDLMNLQI